ncbi:uncharacterized protein LOC130895668 isoform X2 [Diorhabda carinulata]|uniref:uncharacterized protein LOC130895668 isoform X2 n=1 Tax=Diorhabda carinulata TaxID=1163345 RepID=UPI0025A2E757|nr:uncharacterized protein LOC130895668 isoform X2 [Diorhabda carinulata]
MMMLFDVENMLEVRDQIGFVVFIGLIIFLLLLLRKYVQVKRRQFKREIESRLRQAHQQEDIYNISSQVQNQEQWPTHNAHLSLDHITLMNQMNKSAYDDAPPSYDEVMKASLQNNGGTSTSELPPPPPPSHAVIVVPPTTTTTSQ